MLLVAGCAAQQAMCGPGTILNGGLCCPDTDNDQSCDPAKPKDAQIVLEVEPPERVEPAVPQEIESLKVEDVQKILREIYGSKTMFSAGKGTFWHLQNETYKKLKISGSVYADILMLTNKSDYFSNNSGVQKVVEPYIKNLFWMDKANVTNSTNTSKEGVIFIHRFRIIKDEPWWNYEMINGGKTYDIIANQSGLIITKPTTPYGQVQIYVPCPPNVVVAFYNNKYGGIGTDWTSIEDDQYDRILEDSFIFDREGAMDEALRFRELCDVPRGS